jgi:glycosyltransferase involved in cell wall biosynthesis
MSWLLVILLIFLGAAKSKEGDGNLSVSIVIPAYNEEENLANVVNVVKGISYVSEVIVVDDGSTDKTAQIAKEAGVSVISHVSNQGKGAAIKTGFRHSKGDIVAFIDADIENLTKKQVDTIIEPIIHGKANITKTKFHRDSGRVTELTAKPLLRFFFPEISFEQPLSGQFAGKRTSLNRMKFEKDYGVDVGIVLDADAKGIKIDEVDIGEIKHQSSSLTELNPMANEVVRTIINRAMEYGRISMMDTVGNYIRMVVLGLSLIILGLFVVFFVRPIPFVLGIVISAVGLIITVYYLIKLVKNTLGLYRKGSNRNLLKSFVKLHFPILVSGFILILMLSTFIGTANISDGKISIEPTSRNLIIFPGSDDQTISVRGPYTVDSALEDESNIIRMPQDALTTLELQYGDIIFINDNYYTINQTRVGEEDILRLPADVRKYLDLRPEELISDGSICGIFEGSQVKRQINISNSSTNSTISENFYLNSRAANAKYMEIYFDNKLISKQYGVFTKNDSYSIYVNGNFVQLFKIRNLSDNSYFAYYNQHIIELKLFNKTASIKSFLKSDQGPILSFNLV